MKIPINKIIITGDNPRQNFDEEKLRQLGESIKIHGQLQQIIVRTRGSNYELIIGERRLRACALVGLVDIDAEIREVDDSEALELRLIENIQREDLTDAEKGDAVYALWANSEKYETIKDVAEAINVSYATVSYNWCAKSRKLSTQVRRYIADNGSLTDEHARLLLKYSHKTQEIFSDLVIKHRIPKRQLIELIKKYDADPSIDLEEAITGIPKRIEIPKDLLTEEQIQIIEERKQAAKIQPIKKKPPSIPKTKEQIKEKLRRKREPKTFVYEKVKISPRTKNNSPPLKQEVKPQIIPIPETPDYSLCKCAICPLFGKSCRGRCWK